MNEWLAWAVAVIGGCILLGLLIATALILMLAIAPGAAVRTGAEVAGVFLAAFAILGLVVLGITGGKRWFADRRP